MLNEPKVVPKSWKNVHVGKRGFVMGCGPSLRAQAELNELEWLKDEVTIGTNRMYETFMPKYLCVADKTSVSTPYAKEFEEQSGKTIMVFSVPPCVDWPKSAFTVPLNTSSRWGSNGEFRPDFDFTSWGRSVVLDLALPFAVYLGLNPIYLLGCDCTSEGHCHSTGEIEKRIVSENVWHLIFEAFEDLGKKFSALGGAIYNSTLGGNLEVFPRVSLSTLFTEGASK